MPIPKFVKSVRLADYSQVINSPNYENTPLFSFVALSHTKIGFSDYKQDSTKSFRHQSGRLICNDTLSSPLFQLGDSSSLSLPTAKAFSAFSRPSSVHAKKGQEPCPWRESTRVSKCYTFTVFLIFLTADEE